MEVVKLVREHWLLAGFVVCIFWPALLIFSPVYLPPLLLYILHVRYNEWKVDPEQSSQFRAGKEESVNCTTTEKHVIKPASEARPHTEQALNLSKGHVGEDGRQKVDTKEKEKHESSNQDTHPDQGSSEKGFHSDIDHQKSRLFSTQAELSTQGGDDLESRQDQKLGKSAAQDADAPTSEPSATQAAAGGITGNAALGKPKSQPLTQVTISVNADLPTKSAVVSPKKTPLGSPKKLADNTAKKLETATAKKPLDKSVDGSAFAKETEAPSRLAAQPLKNQSLDAAKVSGAPKEPPAVAGRGAKKSEATVTTKGSREEHAHPVSEKQEQSPALVSKARPVLEATKEPAPSSSSEPVPSVGVSPGEGKGSVGPESGGHRSDHHKSKSKKKKKSHASK